MPTGSRTPPTGTSPGYPTSNRLLADPDDLLQVGNFDTDTGMVEVSNSEALEAWLAEAHAGALPDLDTETRTTVAPDFAG